MAKAPKPGHSRRISFDEDILDGDLDEQWYRIVYPPDNKDVTVKVSQLGPRDDDFCKANTGHEAFELFGPFLATPIGVIIGYWFARTKNGEPNLKFKKIWNQFNGNYELLRPFEVHVPADPDDDDAEEIVDDDGPEAAADPTG